MVCRPYVLKGIDTMEHFLSYLLVWSSIFSIGSAGVTSFLYLLGYIRGHFTEEFTNTLNRWGVVTASSCAVFLCSGVLKLIFYGNINV